MTLYRVDLPAKLHFVKEHFKRRNGDATMFSILELCRPQGCLLSNCLYIKVFF